MSCAPPVAAALAHNFSASRRYLATPCATSPPPAPPRPLAPLHHIVNIRWPCFAATPQALADATVFSRDMMMERADVASPEYIASVAEAVAKDHNMQVGSLRTPGLWRWGRPAASARAHPALTYLSRLAPSWATTPWRRRT